MITTIENYRGFDIEFNTSSEKFLCIVTEETTKESKSFSAVRKFVDDYKKDNQNFKPFNVVTTLIDNGVLAEPSNENAALPVVGGSLPSEKLYTTKEIREKLLEINPQVIEDSEYTNPFLYRDTKDWYDELE